MTSTSRPPRRLPRAVALAASTSLLMLAADAAAQPADSEARARTLYEEGTRLLDAGATAEACPKLEEAVRLVPDASGAHLALGVCLERAGRLATALHHLERAEALADPVALGERRERAAQAAAALRPRVARIRVVVEQGTSPSAVVTIDGRVVPRGEAIAVDAGRHEVVLSDMGGRALARHSLQVVDGALERVVLSGPAAPDSTTSSTRPQGSAEPTLDEGGGPPWATVGVVALAVGGAGLALGAVSAAVAAERDAASADECDTRDFCTDAGFAARDEAFTWATVSTVGFLAGGALAATGLVLVLVGDDTSEASAGRGGPAPAGARAEAVVGPGGLRVRGVF